LRDCGDKIDREGRTQAVTKDRTKWVTPEGGKRM
jgi:hypothetical protein